MNDFVRILAFIKPYWLSAVLNAFFNLLAIVFSLISITMVIPFLGVLFNTQEKVYSAPALSFSVPSIKENFLFFITRIIDSRGETEALAFICIIVACAFLFRNLFRYLALFFMSPLRASVVRDLRQQLYKKLSFLPLSFFSNNKKGELISRMSNDVQEVEWTIMTSLELVVKEPITILVYLITLFFWSPPLTLFVFILLPIAGFLIARIAKSLKKSALIGQKQIAEVLSIIEETLSGIKVLRAFNAIDYSVNKFNAATNKHKKTQIKILRKKDLSSPISELLSVFVLVVVMWYGGKIVFENSGFSAEVFIAYIALFSQIIPPAKSFTTAIYNIQKGNASAQRIYEILDEGVSSSTSLKKAPLSSFKNSISFKEVSFSYEKKQVLKEINITINKGERVALVGPSGSGKTTLINLILGFYKTQTGTLLIDNKPIKNYAVSDLLSLIGLVSQDVVLFNDTIHNNISLGAPNANKKTIEDAAKTANAHRFITEMPLGYNSIIGDMGVKLSGGQKQRISIARALLKNPKVLILDEATSSLDTESELLVQKSISSIMKNRTSIVVSHRISTIKNVDRIIVLNRGSIAEQGTHEQLMKRAGLYKKLYEIQSLQL